MAGWLSDRFASMDSILDQNTPTETPLVYEDGLGRFHRLAMHCGGLRQAELLGRVASVDFNTIRLHRRPDGPHKGRYYHLVKREVVRRKRTTGK